MNKSLDIICATYGNLPMVKECIETWFPVPEGWNVYIYDSQASELDGTKEYLRAAKDIFGFNLIEDGRILTHSVAIEELMKKSKSEWILHLDSDVKILNKKVFEWINEKINNTNAKLLGQIDPRHFTPYFNHYATDGNYRICVPRTASWIMLFQRKFIDEHELSFSNMDLRFPVSSPNNMMNLSINHKIDKSTNRVVSPKTMNVLADVSWQVFWEAYRQDAFEKIPNEIWNMFEHKHGGSRTWRAKNKHMIFSPTNDTEKITSEGEKSSNR